MMPYNNELPAEPLHYSNYPAYYTESTSIPPQIPYSFAITPQVMSEYLRNKQQYQCSLAISYPKVVQKSYKTEKRFFCPPPALEIDGLGWERLVNHSKFASNMKGGAFEPLKDIKITTRVAYTTMQPTSMDIIQRSPNALAYFHAKQLYISDSEKKKIIVLKNEVHLPGLKLGEVVSDRIKVISKPSKKKQTMLGPEAHFILIRSGSRIALYNRLRCQTISTRFLHVESNSFYASSSQWSIFDIYLVNHDSDSKCRFEPEEGFLCYGQLVRLVDVGSGLSLPKLTIRRVSKENNIYQVLKNSGEPVSQLHMCAFEFVDDAGNKSFLHASSENIIYDLEKPTKDGAGGELRDGSRWTIASAERVKHSFAPMFTNLSKPVSPYPKVKTISGDEVDGADHYLELLGDDLNKDLTVWFGTVESPKHKYRSLYSLACMIPPFEDFCRIGLQVNSNGKLNPVPISLARKDGVIYDTNFLYEYNVNKAGPIGHVISQDVFEEQKQMFEKNQLKPKYPATEMMPLTYNLPFYQPPQPSDI